MIRKRNLIGVFYDEKRTEFICDLLIKHILPYEVFNQVVLVCNSDVSYQIAQCKFTNFPKIIVIQHNNEFAEFGAMTEAVRTLKSRGELSNSQNIFFNDTIFFNFKSNFRSTLYFLVTTQQHLPLTQPYIIGYIAYLKTKGEVFKLSVDKWAQTALFVMNNEALEKISDDFVGSLRLLKTDVSKERIYSNSFELLNEYFDPDVLSYHVGKWLFAGEWYKSSKYHDFNRKSLIQKIESIALEKYLSARLISENAKFSKGFFCTKRELLKTIGNSFNFTTLRIYLFLLKFHFIAIKLK
jgi:hypothetical protein